MRVVHVADGAKLTNELGRHLSLLLRGLQKRGVDVTLVTTSNAPLGFAEGMAVARTSNFFGLMREISDQRPELVHLHTPFLAGEVAAVLINTPVVISLTEARRRVSILDWALRRRGHHAIREPLGVDLENLSSPDELGVEALRQAYEQPIVLCMTPWQNESGLATLLEAWSRLEKGTLLLVGSASDERALRDQVEIQGLAHRVAFLSPPTNERLPNLYHAAAIFVQLRPLSDFGGDLSLLEAQACGIPTIREAGHSLNVGLLANIANRLVNSCGIPSRRWKSSTLPPVLEEDEGGLMVSPSQVTLFADALRRLTEDEARRRRLGESGKARVRRDFSEQRMVEAVWDVYQQMLKQKNDV